MKYLEGWNNFWHFLGKVFFGKFVGGFGFHRNYFFVLHSHPLDEKIGTIVSKNFFPMSYLREKVTTENTY